jgi:hypothetical protein
MRVLGRVVAVVVAALAYVLVTVVVVIAIQALRGPSASEEFSRAVLRAWVDDGAPANVCGYPDAARGETVHVSHEDIVAISRCLEKRGNLTSNALARNRG